jgi:uncharacterized metal-binding protein
MPDSKTHREYHKQYAVLALPPAMVVGYYIEGFYGVMLVVLGYVLHRFFSQDLDQIGITTEEAEWSKTVVLSLLVGWSTMYARIIYYLPPVLGFPKGHRSFWSHFPPVGAFFRLLWFWLPFQWVFSLVWSDSIWMEFLLIYVGLMAADWIHSIADWLDTKRIQALRKSTHVKKTNRNLRKK